MTPQQPDEFDSTAWTGPVDLPPRRTPSLPMTPREKRIGIGLCLVILVTFVADEIWLAVLHAMSPAVASPAAGQVVPLVFQLRYHAIGGVFHVRAWQVAVHRALEGLGMAAVILLFVLAVRMRCRRA